MDDGHEEPRSEVKGLQTPLGYAEVTTTYLEDCAVITITIDGEEVERLSTDLQAAEGFAARELACLLDDRPLEEKFADSEEDIRAQNDAVAVTLAIKAAAAELPPTITVRQGERLPASAEAAGYVNLGEVICPKCDGEGREYAGDALDPYGATQTCSRCGGGGEVGTVYGIEQPSALGPAPRASGLFPDGDDDDLPF